MNNPVPLRQFREITDTAIHTDDFHVRATIISTVPENISARSEIDDIWKAQEEEFELFPWIPSVNDRSRHKNIELSGPFACVVMSTGILRN
jgi:hypothetical protein